MRFRYIISPELIDKLAPLELDKRVKSLNVEDRELPYPNIMFERDLKEWADDFKEDGYLDTLPSDLKKEFIDKMNAVVYPSGQMPWIIKTGKGTVKSRFELDDVIVLSGIYASFVLSPDELWKGEEFGFESPFVFAGSVGAVLWNIRHGKSGRGYEWCSPHPDGKILENIFAEDMHYDFRLIQKDITSYNTKDPLGHYVMFRPELDTRRGIFGSDQSEPYFLALLLRYGRDANLDRSVLDNEGRELIEWTNSLGQRGGCTAEHLSPNRNSPFHYLICYDESLPRLDENHELVGEAPRFHGMASRNGFYQAFIGPDEELIFYREHQIEEDPSRELAAVYLPSEFEHLMKGLMWQAANGLGRTPADELTKTLQYALSGKYEEDLVRITSRIRT